MAETRQATTDNRKLTVFLSYSRKDNLSFADQVVKGLETFGGMSVLLDRNSIAGGEVWTARTQHLIESCDTILLALSPEAVKSEICNWEIDLALATKKRVFTVFNHDMPDATVPERVRTIHRIFFFENPAVPGSGFATGLAELVEMLRTDVAWVRKHSEVAAAAKRWDDHGRRTDDLYKGSQLEEALKWRAARPAANAPELTDLQAAFLNESDAQAQVLKNAERLRNEKDRRRNSWIAVTLLAMFGVLMMAGVIAFGQGKSNAYNRSLLFAELSQQSFDKSDYAGAMRWALAGLDTGGGEIFGPDSDLAEIRLTQAHYFQPLRAKLKLPVSRVAYSPDGSLLAVLSANGVATIMDGASLSVRNSFQTELGVDESQVPAQDIRLSPDKASILFAIKYHPTSGAQVFDLNSGKLKLALPIPEDAVVCARYSSRGDQILTAHMGGTAQLWDAATGKPIRNFDQHYAGVSVTEGNRLACAELSADGAQVVTAGDDGNARIWDTKSGKLLQTIKAAGPLSEASFSMDGRFLVTASVNRVAQLWELETSSHIADMNHPAPVTSAAFSSDSTIVLTQANDGVARIWSVAAMTNKDRSLDTLRSETGDGNAYRMSFPGALASALRPDGARAAGAGPNGVLLWDAQTWAGAPVSPQAAQSQGEGSATSKFARAVVFDAPYHGVRIVDAATGAVRLTLPHDDQVNEVRFTSDGLGLFTTVYQQPARFYDLSKFFGGTRSTRIADACKNLAALGEAVFTPADIARPILDASNSAAVDPCRRKGLLNGAWWFGEAAPAKP